MAVLSYYELLDEDRDRGLRYQSMQRVTLTSIAYDEPPEEVPLCDRPIVDNTNALIWQAIDRIFGGADARTVCAELEVDLYREQAERLLTRCDRLVDLLRATDPKAPEMRRAGRPVERMPLGACYASRTATDPEPRA